jgi:hypothetical protein
MEETWKDIPGLDGRYQASNLGRIRSVKILKPRITSGTGYLCVTVTGQKKIATHALVARTYLGPCPPGKEVNHINSNRQDPRPENLEYVTRSENNRHAFLYGNRNLYFSEAEMDKIADHFFTEQLSICGIARSLLPENYSAKEERAMRKRVRSVIEIWRASQRKPNQKNPYERKLDAAKAEKIRSLYRGMNISQKELAKMYGVNPSHISRIVNNVAGYFSR